jgi:hypothetical protein
MTRNKFHAGVTQLGTTIQNLVAIVTWCLDLCILVYDILAQVCKTLQVITSNLPKMILSMLHERPEPPLLIVCRLCSDHRSTFLAMTKV